MKTPMTNQGVKETPNNPNNPNNNCQNIRNCYSKRKARSSSLRFVLTCPKDCYDSNTRETTKENTSNNKGDVTPPKINYF